MKLHLGWKVWPLDKVKVSNDGGFAPSKTRVFDLVNGEPIPWRLVVLGNERLPKTVYVRFHSPSAGGGWQPETFTDDIVLDTVVPQILSVTLLAPGAASLAASRRSLRIKAERQPLGQVVEISSGKPRKKAKVVSDRKAVPAPDPAGSREGVMVLATGLGGGEWRDQGAVGDGRPNGCGASRAVAGVRERTLVRRGSRARARLHGNDH